MNTKQLFQAFMAIGVLGGASSLLSPTEVLAQSSATVGTLHGVLKDKATGEAAVGATVVATSPALVGEQVVITDENGQYFINSLPPGLYTLTIYYNNQPFSRQGVLIQLGKEAVVNVTVDSASTKGGGPSGEVIEIKGTVPIIDQGSTKTGVTLTDDFTRNVPTGRTFAGVLGSVAGSQGDQYGVSLSGATSAENVYVVEGINTTDTGFGGVSSNLPNEFIAETEIITGGYNAEFGRATGGIVNVVTKSGSNQFRGSVFGYLTPGGLVADAKAIQREGSAIDAETNLNYAYDIGAEVGGPIIKDKLWFHVGINPSSNKTTVTRLIQRQKDLDADGIPDIDPTTGFTLTEAVTSSDLTQQLTTYFYTAKINGAVNQNNQFQISLFGNPRSGEAVTGIVRNPANSTFNLEDGAYDVAAKWTSKFNEGKTQVDAVLGFHRQVENQTPQNAGQDVAFVRYNFERSLFDFESIERGNLAGCDDSDPNDPYPMIQNCPVFQYASQGLGFLEERTNDRTSAVVALTQRVKAAGYHTFKVGLDAELATYNSHRAFTGGQFWTRNADVGATGAPGNWQLRENMRIVRPLNDADDITVDADMDGIPDLLDQSRRQILCAADRAICETANDGINADTNNSSYAAFIQDSWQIRPNLTLNAGLRWEQQTGFVAKALQGQLSPQGEIIPEAAYKLENQIAPRVGFIYDPTQEGKSKIFGHWGRFYENVPMDLNVRAFGGEITHFERVNAGRRLPDDPMYNANCDVNFGDPRNPDLAQILNQCPSSERFTQTLLGEGTEFVAPGLKGQFTQELILGTEYELLADFKVGLNYIHRSLPQVIEDVSTDGGANYLIANPGEDFSGAADDLRVESNRLLMESGCTSFDDTGENCDATKQALAILQDDRARQLESVVKFDKPTRSYDALQMTVQQRPTKRSLLQASYTYSVSKGNYPGLFSTETGQLDPNLTSLYDLPDLMANRYGPMGLDRPHNVKIDGFYQFPLGKVGVLTTGASFRAQSGIAHNALGGHIFYGDQESYLLPRGAIARSPVTFQSDIHLSAGYRVNKNTMVEAFVRVFNVFDGQEELDIDEEYTVDNVNPIVNGDAADLAHVKILDETFSSSEINQTATPNKNFGNLNARQSPRNVQLGFRVTF